MPYYTKDQIAQARELDLLAYLQRYEPEELVHFSGNTYTTRTHDSLKISNGKWCWWSRGVGGSSALDYLIHVKGYTFLDAVGAILGDAPVLTTCAQSEPNKPKIQPIQFKLPPKHADNRRVFSYLKSRGIDPEIINHCIKEGQLYEEAQRHNCVFVGYEGDKPKYGNLRGTLSQSTFVGDVPGSDKRFSFAVPKQAGENEILCVFECAIDALSYLSLIKLNGHDWRRANCLSLAGVYQPQNGGRMKFPLALEQYLMDNAHIATVLLCLDNDGVGRVASLAIKKHLEETHVVIDNPPKAGKDYNEFLQMKKGITGRVKTRGKGVR